MRFKPFVVFLAVAAVSAPAEAQWRRVELIPELGYTWGGGRSFDAQTINTVAVPGGKFELKSSMAYGVTLAIEGYSGNFFELSYMRQDTDLGIEWNQKPPAIIVPNPDKTGGMSTNQFLLGFRQELVKEERAPTRPYLGAGLGFNVLDPKFNSVGGVSVDASTNFMLAANGGVKHMFGVEQRVGLKLDIKGTWTFVPSGDYTVWCDYWYGCSSYEGTATVAQGTVKAGLVIKF